MISIRNEGQLMEKIYYNGDIITMKSETDNPECVVTQNDTIIYTGSLNIAKGKYPDADMVNLKKCTLMPAFIDAHSHFFQTAQSINMCDLSETGSFEDVKNTLKRYITDNKLTEDDMVFASGYDHNFLLEHTHPDKRLLDEVSKTIPIYISHVSGHMGVANQALLNLAGITDSTPDPDGGKYGRMEDGTLSGYVEEIPALMNIIAPAMQRVKVDMPSQIKKAQELYLKYGITTVQEGAASKEAAKAIVGLSEAGLINIDVVMYIMNEDYKEACNELHAEKNNYNNHIKIGGAKIILDGSPQGKSAWLTEPYEGEHTYCGYPSHDMQYVINACEAAIKGNYQLLAHCNGDAASEQFIESYSKALENVRTSYAENIKANSEDSSENSEYANYDMISFAKNYRPVMIHCQTVRDDQLDRMVKLNMIPSIFVGHVYYWGDIHMKNLGRKRADRISPVKSALKRGLVYNFHQDTPVTKPDMLHSIWCAVNRITRNGQKLSDEQCIDVYDALKAVTINAAYEYSEENIKGTIEAGKKADLVVLSDNPLKADRQKIKDIIVEKTIKDGVELYKRI